MRERTLRAVFAAAVALCLPQRGLAQTVDELVARNVAARGGAKLLRALTSLRSTGEMDAGQGMKLPYVLEQKRPDKMRLEFVFEGQTAVQCFDGRAGFKLVPFRDPKPEPLTEAELSEVAGFADPSGLLFDYSKRGHAIELLGKEQIQGRDAFKLKVSVPGGSVRWVYLDPETGLEVKVDAMRTIGGSQRRVETYYHDWKAADGLLVPRRYETRTDGVKEVQTFTVESVQVNPPLDDSRFAMPAKAPAPAGQGK